MNRIQFVTRMLTGSLVKNDLKPRRYIFLNFFWLLWDRVFRLCGGLIIGVWLARYLGPEDYGKWSFAAAFAALFAPIASLGLDSVVVRDLVQNPERRGVVLGSAFALKLVGSVVGCVLCLVFAFTSYHSDPVVVYVITLSAIGLIFQSFGVIDFHFQSKVMSKWVVVATNLAFTISALAKIYFFLTHGDLIDLAWVGLFEIGLTAAFLMIAYRLDAGKFSEWRVSGAEIYRLLVDGFPLLFAGLAVAMYMRIDVVMLQHMKGAGEVGVYAAAVKVSEVLYFLPGIMVSSIAPALINAYKTDLASYTFNVRRLYFVSTWISIVVAIPVCAMSDLIVRLLFSSTFSDAAGVLSIHTWASVAVYLGVASSQCLVIEGLQKISFYRTLMGCALNIVLNIALIPTWGATGAALATVVSYFFATYSMLFYKAARHHFHLLIRSPFMFKELLHND